MTTPQVTVVIVTFNSRDTVGAALDALREANEDGLARVVVVDNASADGTAYLIAQRHPWVTLVPSRENLGYGRGCNLGFEHVTTRYVLFMNPDAVVGLRALKTLVTFMDSHLRAGMCGPAVREASGALQPAGALPTPWRIILKPLCPAWATRGQRHVIPGEDPSPTNWLCGSIVLLRKSVIDDIGGFDPRFFLYFEETDLCYRAQQSGWQIWTVGAAVCKHVNAASAHGTNLPMMWGTIVEHYFRSRFYYMMKHYGWPLAVTAEVGELISMFVRAAIDRMRGRSYAHLGPRLRASILRLPPKMTGAAAFAQPRLKH